MKIRLISAAVMVPLALLLAWVLPKILLALVIAAMSALAAYELLYTTGLVRHIRLVAYCMVTAFAIPLWSYWGIPYPWAVLLVLVFLVVMFAEMMNNHVKVRFEKVCMCVIAGLLLPFLFAAMVRIHGERLGRYLIMVPVILAVIPDTGAYFAGRYFGKHKLAPVISPKKTVEGAIGGGISAVLGMVVFALIVDVFFKREVNYGFALIYGIVGAAADIFGDLMFSAIKRQVGLKDYGNLIPGHGGILDRFDSMLMVAPLMEALLILIPVVV